MGISKKVPTVIQNFNKPGKASILIDGQFGSTGKGLAAAVVALRSPPDICVTNASANAGHTTILEDGTKYVAYHIPTAALVCPEAIAYLDAGAIINPDLLEKEIEALQFNTDRLYIHPNASIIEPEDLEYEADTKSGTAKISSTQKGTGRAFARKIMREGRVAKWLPSLPGKIRKMDLANELEMGKSVMIEVPQGYSLSNHGVFYPYCTSRNINVAQAFSDAELHPSFLGNTIMTVRSFPIRVGNIPGGSSGGCYEDQNEVSWELLGVEPEITTVTKRIRRVFTFSTTQYGDALREIRPNVVFANFCNYFNNPHHFLNWWQDMKDVERDLGMLVTTMYGTGPSVSDVHFDFGETYEALSTAGA